LERSELKIENPDQSDIKISDGEDKTEPDGWIYLGNGNRLVIDDPSDLINKNPNWENIKRETFTLKQGINLRIDKPRPPNYRNQKLLRVLQEETEFTIDTFTIDKKGHHWARIMVQL